MFTNSNANQTNFQTIFSKLAVVLFPEAGSLREEKEKTFPSEDVMECFCPSPNLDIGQEQLNWRWPSAFPCTSSGIHTSSAEHQSWSPATTLCLIFIPLSTSGRIAIYLYILHSVNKHTGTTYGSQVVWTQILTSLY